jgi:hypothetical protein
MRSGILALLVLAGAASPAIAQQGPAQTQTIRVEYSSVVMHEPRGDAVVMGSVTPGTLVDVVRRQGDWYLVRLSANQPAPTTAKWQQGWIHATAFAGTARRSAGTTTRAPARAPARASARAPVRGPMMIRGFAQSGGILFTARDSFDTIFGLPFGWMSGGGGQVVFPNGVFVQGSVERFSKTGSPALVSGNQVFLGDTPDTITLTPIIATVGYRAIRARGVVPYLGGGIGSYDFKEEATGLLGAEDVGKAHVGYHVLGGAELPISRWLSVAGEIQWSAVPKALGETGLSAIYQETDLGGTTFRVKLVLGR